MQMINVRLGDRRSEYGKSHCGQLFFPSQHNICIFSTTARMASDSAHSLTSLATASLSLSAPVSASPWTYTIKEDQCWLLCVFGATPVLCMPRMTSARDRGRSTLLEERESLGPHI